MSLRSNIGIGNIGKPRWKTLDIKSPIRGPIDREPAGGSRFAIEAPCRHMLLERRLEGRDQDLKLLQGQAGEVQKLRRAGLHVSEPDTGHGSCLLSRHPSIRNASIFLIGINSITSRTKL